MCWGKGIDSLLRHFDGHYASKVKKIGGLLVGDPYFGDRHMNMGIHIAVRPSAGLPWEPGQAAGEPVARLVGQGFGCSCEVNSGTVPNSGSVLDKAYLGHHVAGLEVV